jgi:glycosyltransferase involved in cell wall biosynthesis
MKMMILGFFAIPLALAISSINNELSLQLSFLFWVTIAIICSWSYLFFISIRSDILSPAITSKMAANIEKSSKQKQDTRRMNQREREFVFGQIRRKFQQNSVGQATSTLIAQSGITCNNDIETGSIDNSNPFPFVSVVVPARNEQNNIENCLLSLLSQNYPCFEVIAIDDNSTDETLNIMRKLEARISTEKEEARDTEKKLKVITLAEKPYDWAGKTWASHHGYLHSRGDILLFTDADSHFRSTDTLRLAVSYIQQEELDALTGLPYLPVRDFWSKIIEPLWNILIVLGPSIPKVNDPKSKQMLVMGSFFMIKKYVYEGIGTYNAVKDSLQEDTALGNRTRQFGYKLKMAKVDNLVTALLSRNLSTLWHGSIGRNVIHATIENRWSAVKNLIIMSLMTLLPFLVFTFVGLLCLREVTELGLFTQSLSTSLKQLSVIQEILLSSQPLLSIVFSLSLVSYLMVVGGVAVKCVKKYRQSPLFAFFVPIASVFLIIAFLYHILPIIQSGSGTIQWRERFYTVNKNGVLQSQTRAHPG